MIPPTLKLYTPINKGRLFMADITRDAKGWRRSMRSLGGYWMGSFKMETVSRLYKDTNSLIDKFYNWLGCEIVEESYGFMTWQGIVYSMDLTHKGMTRRRSLDMMSNYVTVLYESSDGDAQETAAAENTESSGFYGRREALVTYSGIDATAGTAMRDRYLFENAHPYSHVVGANPAAGALELKQSVTSLEVTCCGYVFTGNWRFESVGDGTADNLSDWISEIVTTDMEFVDVGYIAPNTIQVNKANFQPRRAWDVVQGLVELGDTGGNPYKFHVGNNRLCYYSAIDPTPSYYLRGGKIYASPSGNSPADIWRMRPKVIRDMDFPSNRAYAGGWLTNVSDFMAYEIDCGVDTGLNIKTNLFDESEMLISLADFLKRNERAGEREED